MKRMKESWTLTKREVVLDPQESPGQFKSMKVKLGSESWTVLCFCYFPTAVLRTLSL